MTNITQGTTIIITSGIYKGRTGTVIAQHKGTITGEGFYSIDLEIPKSVKIPTEHGDIVFKDHTTVLIDADAVMVAKPLGRALYT